MSSFRWLFKRVTSCYCQPHASIPCSLAHIGIFRTDGILLPLLLEYLFPWGCPNLTLYSTIPQTPGNLKPLRLWMVFSQNRKYLRLPFHTYPPLPMSNHMNAITWNQRSGSFYHPWGDVSEGLGHCLQNSLSPCLQHQSLIQTFKCHLSQYLSWLTHTFGPRIEIFRNKSILDYQGWQYPWPI